MRDSAPRRVSPLGPSFAHPFDRSTAETFCLRCEAGARTIRRGTPWRPEGSAPELRGSRRSSQPGGRLSDPHAQSPAIRSRTASAVSARSSARSARSSTPVGRMRGSSSTGRSKAGGRWTTAADSRASGRAAAIVSIASGSGGRASSWQIRPREATAASGRCAARRSSSLRAPAVAISVGRGARPSFQVDQQRRPIGLRCGAGERRSRGLARPLAAPTVGLTADRSRRPASRSLRPRRGGGGDGEPVGNRGQRRRRAQAHGDASAVDRDVDVVLGPTRQRLARRLGRGPPGRPAPALPPRRRRRRGSARSRWRAAAGRAGPPSSSAGRAATSSTVLPGSRPSLYPSPGSSAAFAPTVSRGITGSSRGIANADRDRVAVAHLRAVPHRRRQRSPRRRLGVAADQRRPRPRPRRHPRRPERLLRRARSVPRPGPPAAGTEPRRPSRPTRSRPPCESCWRPGATHADRPRPETRVWRAQTKSSVTAYA